MQLFLYPSAIFVHEQENAHKNRHKKCETPEGEAIRFGPHDPTQLTEEISNSNTNPILYIVDASCVTHFLDATKSMPTWRAVQL